MNEAPVATQKFHESKIHGIDRQDPYHWLREREQPEVLDYLKAENAFTDKVLAPTQPQQEKLYREILGRIQETDLSVPVRMGPFIYYSRTEAGKNYSILCRKQNETAPEEVLLDLNQLAEGHSYFSLGAYEISPDHHLLAFSTDTNGSETYQLFVKDLVSGSLIDGPLEGCSAGAVWAEDGKTLFYSTQDETKRPNRIWRHSLKKPQAKDFLVYEESDELFNVQIRKTKSRKFLFIESESKTTSEVRFLDAGHPEGEFVLFAKRSKGVEYSLSHQGNRFLILTNENAVNFKLLETSVEKFSRENWQEVIPHRPEVKLEGVESFQDYLIIYEREKGLNRILVHSLKKNRIDSIPFPEPVYTAWGGSNPEYDAKTFRYGYCSLVTPSSVMELDLEIFSSKCLKQQPVLGDFSSSRYESKRMWAVSHDGVRVPISLVYRKDRFERGECPILLAGYGSYGISYDPEFSSTRLSLLDRGWVYAIAHIRGGGDLGRPWYEEGKFLKKKNTFLDFIACAETLIRERWCHPKKICISGGSAGGLLIGNVINQQPELFHAAIAKVPFVDVLNTMLDKSLPLTIGEYEEWGNPEEKKYFESIASYSPYDNVKKQKYPHLLVTAGLFDPRVQYWEPAKWVAKLRRHSTSQRMLLLKTILEAGHGGPSGRYEALREVAMDYAFLLYSLEDSPWNLS